MEMQKPRRTLEDLRREIDRIDDAIHDLVMRRAALLIDIAAAKGAVSDAAGSYLRPGREAVVLRRLLARHRGPFPKPALVRLWREIISAPLALQGVFSVAVSAPNEAPGYWDLARDHYGTVAAMSAHDTPGQVLRALGEGRAVLGVLPAFAEEEPDPWWRHLAREGRQLPAIIARLPMAPGGNARAQGLSALVVGPDVGEPTGRDRSYVVFESGEELSRARLKAALASAGIEASFLARWSDSASGRTLILAELEGFFAGDEAPLARFASANAGSIRRQFRIGSYALPFDAKEMAPRKAKSA